MKSFVETHKGFTAHRERKALIISFPRPVSTLSWGVLNGGFYSADYIVIFQVSGRDREFTTDPSRFLKSAARDLGLEGRIVGMATSVDVASVVSVSFSHVETQVSCFATVGWGNALSVGDPTTWQESDGKPLNTINLILLIQPGLMAEAMVEAVQIATEGRIRALNEARISSSRSSLPATGTGTDCIAIVSLNKGEAPYCGKHTKFGELIGLAAYAAVKKGLAMGLATSGLKIGG